MSDHEAMAENYKHIWLQPLCCTEERCWCEDPQPCDDCGLPAIKYVRADLVGAVPIADWKIVADESVLIYVVHTNAQYEKDEKRRREEWEGWTVGRWITHNNGGWMYYGMMGSVTHVAPLPAAPQSQVALTAGEGEKS